MEANAKGFERAGEDDGTVGSTWLPQALAARMGAKPTMLMARDESGDACYYVLNYSKRESGVSAIRTGFFKVEGNKVFLLGESLQSFPFGRFIKNPQVLEALWKDFLNRWIKGEGKEGVQKKIEKKSRHQITEEEAFYLEQAGFEVPLDAQRVELYHQDE